MQIIKTSPGYLGKYIKLFYSIQADDSTYIDSAHRRLPDGTLDLVFNLGSSVQFSRNESDFLEMPEIAVTGLYHNRNFLRYKGKVHIVGAVFQPGSAHLFVNDNLEQFEQYSDHANLIFGNNVYHILEKLKNIPGEKEKYLILETFLSNCLRKNSDEYNSNKILHAVQQIHVLNGNVKIPDLYTHNLMSERNFRRKFTEYVGMSPKKYASIIRIKSFSKLCQSSGVSFSKILNELEYSDQSHFNKDFHAIVGINPTNYFSQLNKIGEKYIHLI
jgi:AraC-like DNA-binding protein